MDDRIYELIILELSQESSESESKEFEAWLNASEENKIVFNTMYQYWINTQEVEISRQMVFDKIRTQLDSKSNPQSLGKSRMMPQWLKIAAMLVLMIGVGWAISNLEWNAKKVNSSTIVEKFNPPGQKSTITLNDGSKIILNAESKVSYDKGFTSYERKILLEGEAFFEVAKDSLRPFKVVSGDLVTTALGTSFNIYARPNKNPKVSLATGVVKIEELNSTNNDEIILQPGEEALYSLKNSNFQKHLYNPKEVLSWKDGIIYFKNANQKVIIEKLERWYGVEINVINESVEKIEITTSFKNESLENVLKSLSYTMAFEFTILNKKINIEYLN